MGLGKAPGGNAIIPARAIKKDAGIRQGEERDGLIPR